MAASRLIQLVSQKIIKPSSPTPFSRRTHKISFIDKLNTSSYIPMTFFYRKKGNNLTPNKLSQILQASLSKTLTLYYPFAGRLIDNAYVDCNDMGAEFHEVKIDCDMSDIFNHRYTNIEQLVFPKELPWSTRVDNLLVAQVNHFNCGGIAISACMSHKLVDACSAINFINDWATIARNTKISPPQFSVLPSFSDVSNLPVVELPRCQCISRRYIFSNSKLNYLKAMIYGESKRQYPTSIEAVTSYLYKCATSSKSSRPSVLTQTMNLRPILKALLPNNYVGNASTSFWISAKNHEEDMKLERLVAELRKEKEYTYKRFKDIQSEELLSAILDTSKMTNTLFQSNDFDLYKSTSLCKYPISQVDFGWGQPSRFSVATVPINNMFLFMESQNGDGIEALVSMEEKEMSAFESNQELLEFTSPILGHGELLPQCQ